MGLGIGVAVQHDPSGKNCCCGEAQRVVVKETFLSSGVHGPWMVEITCRAALTTEECPFQARVS